MFGMRHCGAPEPALWGGGGRGWRRRHGGGFGWGGRHGLGGGDMIRAGRMLATGDLRLIALAPASSIRRSPISRKRAT